MAIAWAPAGSGRPAMESHAFFRAFGWLPGPIARPLDRVLTWKNERGLLADEERHLRVYRAYAASCRDSADIVVIGHVHRAVDEAGESPRLIVLGGWQHRSSYLKIDEAGATLSCDSRSTSPGETRPEAEDRRRQIVRPNTTDGEALSIVSNDSILGPTR